MNRARYNKVEADSQSVFFSDFDTGYFQCFDTYFNDVFFSYFDTGQYSSAIFNASQYSSAILIHIKLFKHTLMYFEPGYFLVKIVRGTTRSRRTVSRIYT